MFRSDVERNKRFLGPIIIIETDFEVVDLCSDGHDFCSRLGATLSSCS